MPLDHRDLDQITRHIGPFVAILGRDFLDQMLGDDLAGQDADHMRLAPVPRRAEMRRLNPPRLDRVARHRLDDLTARKSRIIHHHPAANHRLGVAGLKVLNNHDIRPLTRRDQPAILQAERLCRRQARRAINRQRRGPQRDRCADHIVQMAMFRDVQRVPVIGAKRDIGRVALGDNLGQGVQILRY
ncbi:hypothetical protein GALL_434890 [mine drainage metagenome]|uniref:Uncharacterized protein n=1 Tax=mine drainage metagenome TaxID=410659 RepID=A0A1J5PUP1_9ZZZZ